MSRSILLGEQRVQLIVAMVKRSHPDELTCRMEEFGLFDLDRDQRYELMKEIANDLHWIDFLANNSSKLRPEEWTLEQSKELAKRFRSHHYNRGFASLKLLLGSHHGERIEIISSLVGEFSNNEKWECHQFSKKILEEELDLREAPFEKRMELLQLISFDTYNDVYSLIPCKNLGLAETIARFDSLEERFAWATSLVNLYEGAAIECAHHFDELRIEDGPAKERLALLQLIEKRGKVAATIVGTFSKDTLTRATMEQIIAFVKTIVVHREGRNLFMKWFAAFGLETATEEQMADLASYIAVHDLAQAIEIAEKKLSIDMMNGISIEALKKIAMKSDIAAIMVVKHCADELFSQSSIDQRTDLLTFLVEQRALAGDAVVHYYEKLQLSKIAADRLAHLLLIMANNNPSATILLIELLSSEPLLFEIPIDRRLDLIDRILQQTAVDASPIISMMWNFQDFTSLDSPKKRLKLAMILAQLSPKSAEKLANGFDQIAIQGATDSEKVQLTTLLVSRMKDDDYCLSSLRKQRSIPKLQLYLELLAPFLPNHCHGGWVAAELKTVDGGSIALLLRKLANPRVTMKMEDFFKELKSVPKLREISELLERELIKQLSQVEDDSKKERIKQQQLPWCAYAATIIYDMTNEEIDWLKSSNLLCRIMEFRSPLLRYPLMRQLSFLAAEQPSLMAQRVADQQTHRAIIWILTSRLSSLGLSIDVSCAFFTHYCKHSFFKETSRAEELISFLLALLSFGPKDEREVALLSHALEEMALQTKELSNQLAQKKKPANVAELKMKLRQLLADRLPLLHNLLTNFGRAVFYDSLASSMNVQDYFARKFTDLFQGSKGVDDLGLKYQKSFGTFRDPKALYTYLGALKTVPKESGAVEALNHYVVSVLEGEFSTMRYATEDHPHLEKLFSQYGVKEKWLAADPSMELDLSEESSDDEKDEVFKEFFAQKILTDHHIDPNEHPFLCAFLRGDEGDHLTALLEKIASERMAHSSEENLEKKRELTHRMHRMSLEREIILLSLAKPKEQKSAFATFLITTQGMNLGELQNDINQLKIKLQPSQRMAHLIIEESDDPCDLLLLGSEIHGSCQRVSGTPNLNKGLLGYLLHGEVRPIVVKDGGGRMVARSIMRLLWDGKRPLLFLERIYDNIGHSKIEEAILKWAVEKAKKMAIPLVSDEVGSGAIYPEEVQFLGGRAPFIYSDGFSGVLKGDQEAKRGGFHTLYSPE